MRLYPVQSMDQFPLTGPPPSSSFTVLPFHYRSVPMEVQYVIMCHMQAW